ncbi:hypothetical protein FRC17_010771 [Serendipita sp. 399]|nr:hypothetical protein FRC17_010771 [Serendipita sp. 399]
MGVQGRTGILNRQRQHRNGINYRPPPGGGMMMLSSTAAAAERRKTYTVDSQASSSEDVAISSSNSDAFHASQGSLSLRRAASEDGISNTVATGQKGASGLRFWKKAFHPTSKRPVLSTIPSVNTILPFDMDKGDNKSEPSTNLERPGDADTAAESDSVRAVLEHSSLLEGPSFHDSQTSPPVSKDCPPTDAASSMAPHVLEGDVDEYRRGRSETANI